MGLTLKDVYDMRNGLVDFTNKLFNTKGTLVFKQNDALDNMISTISFMKDPSSQQEEVVDSKGKKKKVKDPVREEKKRNYIKDFKQLVRDKRDTVSKHSIGLDVYALLVEKYKDLLANSNGKENDPVVVEFGKNVTYLKSQLLKNNVYDFEINDKLKNTHSIDEKIKNGVASTFAEDVEEVREKYGLALKNTNPNKFKENFNNFIDGENLDSFDPKNIDGTNSKFYGLLRNAGFHFSRKMNVNYYQIPTSIEQAPSGYKFNDAGEMVEKESTGFFSSIANFFGRLMNKGKANQYNEQLRVSKEIVNDEVFSSVVNDQKFVDNERKLINLDDVFDKENEFNKSEMKEAIAKQRLERSKEVDDPNKEVVGPGLEQID